MPSSSWAVESNIALGSRWAVTERGTGAERTWNMTLAFGKTDADAVLANLEGICETGNVLLVRSDTQPIWKNLKSVYVKVESFTPTRPPGFTYMATVNLTGVIVGIPAMEGGDALMGYFWQQSPLALFNTTLPSTSPSANAKEAMWYFPWELGGRNGLVTTSGGKSTWATHEESDFVIVNQGNATWQMGKTVDGTTVLNCTPPTGTTSDSHWALKTHPSKNGYWTMRFKSSDTALNVGILIRLTSTATTANGYLARVTSTAAGIFNKVGASYSSLVDSSHGLTLTDGEWHTLTLFAMDSYLVMFIDGLAVQAITDTTYTSAGYMGARVTATTQTVSLADFGHVPHLAESAVMLSNRVDNVAFTNAARKSWRPVGPNLLGQFDQGASWSGAGGATATWDTTVKMNGTASAKVGGSGSNRRINRLLTLTPGKTYVFSGYVKCAAGLGAGNLMLQAWNTGFSATSGNADQTQAQANWQYLSVTFTPTVASIYLQLISTDSGDVWWDSVALHEAAPILVNPYTRLIAVPEMVE